MGIRLNTMIEWKKQNPKAYEKTILFIFALGIAVGFVCGLQTGILI